MKRRGCEEARKEIAKHETNERLAIFPQKHTEEHSCFVTCRSTLAMRLHSMEVPGSRTCPHLGGFLFHSGIEELLV